MIYLDNNATTALDPAVLAVIQEELAALPANPSSVHRFGQRAKGLLAKARRSIAEAFNLSFMEVYFTASATEALNWVANAFIHKGGKILTSAVEHPALFEPLSRYQGSCFVPMTRSGELDLEAFEKELSPDLSLIALMAANNETGVKFPIEEIASIAEKRQVPFFVDATAWVGKEPFVLYPGISGCVFSPHKFHGPKGVGVLCWRKGVPLPPFLLGGPQELGLRAGTENLPAILGAAKAVELLTDLPSWKEQMLRLRTLLEEGCHLATVIAKNAPRICNTSQLSFFPHSAQKLLIKLDQQGIAVSFGSACHSATLAPSRTLLAVGLSQQEANSCLRISLSRFTQQEEIETLLSCLHTITSTS